MDWIQKNSLRFRTNSNSLAVLKSDAFLRFFQNPTRIVPALADCPLNLPNYGVPYSMNRHNLWELPDLAAGNLSLCQVCFPILIDGLISDHPSH